MPRIVFLCGLVVACNALAAAATAVGLVAVMQENAVVSLDVSFPATTNMSVIQSDLQQVARWTGWNVVGEPVHTRGDTISVHAQVAGGEVEAVLNDVVWPLVAAMSGHERLGIVVMGAPVATAAVTIENRFVRLEQSGGQGVQSYQAFIKDNGFESLQELQKPDLSGQGRGAGRRGGPMGLAWVLLIITALAVGAFVYLIMSRRVA
ncbi:MAG: hypothetical protein KKI08_14590 [Armatimonadetes bacterium]|nr:hypothetical protein [Armatimonadota bacterium]